MANTKQIAVLVGSLRKESFNRRLALAVEKLARGGLTFEHLRIDDLPLYNQDFDADFPPACRRLKQAIQACDGLLFVTPEYNRSVPGVLKNAIDIASRPYGKSAWSGKPAAVVTVSPGAIGGFGANHHLRQSLVFLDMPTLQQPEAYIGGAAELFDAQGNLAKESTREFMRKFLAAFAQWIERNAPSPQARAKAA